MKPSNMPKFGVGDKIQIGPYLLEIKKISTWGSEWRYHGPMTKNGRFHSGANVSEQCLMVDGKLVA